MSDSFAVGDVTGNTGDLVEEDGWSRVPRETGGLVGRSKGAIERSWASGRVTGRDITGGLVGTVAEAGAYVDESWASGQVTGEYGVGGLVGAIQSDAEGVSNSFATGRVQGLAFVGGLVGDASALVEHSLAWGEVVGGDVVGGFAGRAVELRRTVAVGDVEGSMVVGGLVGELTASSEPGGIYDSQAWGRVTASDKIAGGLAGTTWATVARSFARGDVHAGFASAGLVAIARSTVQDSWCDGAVIADASASGLVHTMMSLGRIQRAWTASTVIVPEGASASLVLISGESPDVDYVVALEQSGIPLVVSGGSGVEVRTATLAELADPATYATGPDGWDLDDTWAIRDVSGIAAPDLLSNPRTEDAPAPPAL